jgi:predicted metal-dependent HD superfamily phosphohydrolase
MENSKFERASQYAIDLLQRELLPAFTFHSVNHTLDEMVRYCNRLADLEGIGEESRRPLLMAAYFHDVGLTAIKRMDLETFNAGRAIHEEKAVEIVREILPTYGFELEEIEIIARLIMATKWAHTPGDILEQIISDADMSALGETTNYFLHTSETLRQELGSFGWVIEETEWYTDQKELLETHVFHTASARNLFDANKLLNIAAIQSRLDALNSEASEI